MLRTPAASSVFAGMPAFAFLACVLVALTPVPASAKGFLVDREGAVRGGVRELDRELAEAIGEALGCGGHVGPERILQIERRLMPMWQTLPKNDDGNVERRSLRYLVHRDFNRESALHIRGFEPSRPANASGWDNADILGQRVPGFVESVLESQHRRQKGFTLRDAAQIVATLQQLISDSETATLEHAYLYTKTDMGAPLTEEALESILEVYMVEWIVGDDEDSVHMLLENETLLQTSIPHWEQIVGFARGRVKALQYERQRAPRKLAADASSRSLHNALDQQYSFEDAHAVISGITNSFASFWESECSAMKAQLVEMDPHRTGRVPLSRFYGTGLEAEWRFGESEEYLRELGALDETSWLGKQVIIPNYIQAASNCIVASPHYRVCCFNDCEALLDDIEREIGAPSGSPAAVLAIVGNLSSHVSVDEDFPPVLGESLSLQLQKIADAHNGEVPLHGRLFAQWLHYAYPRECPFPYTSGSVASVSPYEYGERYIASEDEMKKYAAENATVLDASMGKEELQWMSQWSAEEELIAPVAVRSLRSGWFRSFVMLGGVALLAAVVLFGAGQMGIAQTVGVRKSAGAAAFLPYYDKDHFV